MDSYDLIVIGTGSAAQVTAARLRRAGRSVAMIDHRPFGGTCALRGCDPKKMLVSGGRSGRLGAPDASARRIAFKRTFTDPVPKKREESFAKQGIDAFHGVARFGGPDTVIVEGRALKGLHSAPALRAGRAATVRRWLGTRDQVRWLSYSAARAE